ncbi:unnamed protein product [Caenorhabditis angaria]|uniref:hydroxyacylglutathione hydrolase n=1 Tax=Caenorhabditis angaria TaxID=860376 RepID=A0A9P1MXH8_9PELO|nr:unnamed protein product [Caenorhabditis angaria]
MRRMVHVDVVRALEDNFMYVVRRSREEKRVLVVDPVEPAKLIDFAHKNQLEIVGSLITHHHWDHAGGTPEFRKQFAKLPIFGGDERIEHLDNMVKHEQELEIAGMKIRCLSTPCHTTGHICYFINSTDHPSGVVLTGDTLFIAGCGKFFEGTAPEMHRNLNEILARLPNETQVFPGHEYTVSNLRFAQAVEPNNTKIAEKLSWSIAQREKDLNTVPSTIGEEKSINPFMRVGISEEVRNFVSTSDLIEGMRKLREAKNSFRPNL